MLVGQSAGALTLAGAGSAAAMASEPMSCGTESFPKGFLWGTATSSYQVEGAPTEDGRAPSIWDTFTHKQGGTYTGDTGDTADDEFHRYREDVAIMRQLGVKSYQFSLSWPRILPSGSGAVNPKGWAYYDKLVDALLEAGIAPFCTLYHWDMPQTLGAAGGWQNKDMAKIFAEYAGLAVRHLGDRVKNFITMSEIMTFIDEGYRYGSDAPGFKLPMAEVNQAAFHAVLGHGLAVQAVRAYGREGTRVGLADNCVSTCPILANEANIAAARVAFREENARVLTLVQEGAYTESYLRFQGAEAPKFTAEELKIVSSPTDFTGLNIYEPTWVRANPAMDSGYEVIDTPKSYPHLAAGWLYFGPESMYWAPKLTESLWGVKEILITENGAASLDVPTNTGEILDTDRILFLRSYLSQLQRAIAEGVPVKGYFLWSLLDNFEWSDGYAMRFGITYVDYKTQKRTLKLSGEFYKEVIARNGML